MQHHRHRIHALALQLICTRDDLPCHCEKKTTSAALFFSFEGNALKEMKRQKIFLFSQEMTKLTTDSHISSF